jgi:hypothetical protein
MSEPSENERLVKRLQKARCWHERDVCGTRATKWFGLRSYDVDEAAGTIARLEREVLRLGRMAGETADDRLVKLEAQRDALLEALREVEAMPQGCSCLPASGCGRARVKEKARVALSLCESKPGRER